MPWPCPRKIATLALLAFAPAGCGPAKLKTPPKNYPGATWEKRAPAALGLRPEVLDRLAAEIGGDGFISRYGYEAYSWGDTHRKRDYKSATKALFSFLAFRAEETGRIPSLDEPLRVHIPALATLNPQLDPADGQFTWRQLSTMTSCYGVTELPGKAFSYSDYSVMLLADSLVKHAYKEPWEAVFQRELAQPLQFQDTEGRLVAPPQENYGWHPLVSARDFNRFGLLMMRGGQWREGRQVLGADRVRTLTHSPLPPDLPETQARDVAMLPGQLTFGGGHHEEAHLGAYGYFWWLNHAERPGGKIWPDAPPDTFAAIGYGGVFVLGVIPSEELVVTWRSLTLSTTSHAREGKTWVNARLKTLMEALANPSTQTPDT